ncbi:histidine kinase [Novimethylophilus kurashikiensis]|uniref:Histidine kinase n=1 Tax=Novimethylophilus kurashikiensis TaxID=1825523 RepID=A0A2R5F8G4_9PROT|nr:hypothetical protein [Novimethylophilus kurashikiensis]GBG14540.1 histidine kinase [Novimethylophilus kurashikiensis]
MSKLRDLFEKYSGEYRKFEEVPHKLSPRPDVCAFLLLDRLLPESSQLGRAMISATGYDVIYLDVDLEALEHRATGPDIMTLCQCGVRLTGNGLEMFV